MTTYTPLDQQPGDEETLSSGNLPKYEKDIHISSARISAKRYLWLLHVICFSANIVFLLYNIKTNSLAANGIEGGIPYKGVPISYKEVIFASSGVHKAADQTRTKWEGSPTEDNEHWWNEIAGRAGFVALDDEEYAALGQTTLFYPRINKHVVLVAMYHQLHCLSMLRTYYWNDQYNNPQPIRKRVDNSSNYHMDHCIDYLRQVLMCHADLTPATFELEATADNAFVTNFAVKHHQCRDFDKIHEWALKREAGVPGAGQIRFGM